MNKIAEIATIALKWELCGTNFRKVMATLQVSCFNRNNDQADRVFFLCSTPDSGANDHVKTRYARVLTASFVLLPLVLDEQHPHSPVIIS